MVAIGYYEGRRQACMVAALLTYRLAETQRVLLVDLDLLCPSIGYEPPFLLPEPPDKGVQDYVLEDLPLPVLTPVDNLSVFMTLGRPKLECIRPMTYYMLADSRAGLLASRIKVGLAQAVETHCIDTCVLLAPPGFAGWAETVHALADVVGITEEYPLHHNSIVQDYTQGLIMGGQRVVRLGLDWAENRVFNDLVDSLRVKQTQARG